MATKKGRDHLICFAFPSEVFPDFSTAGHAVAVDFVLVEVPDQKMKEMIVD